ncbi:MAG: hypothetical protein JW909_00010 [Planctomycetes bacterium]|nr:hypothetical protein [Planctomycetota bacterium]
MNLAKGSVSLEQYRSKAACAAGALRAVTMFAAIAIVAAAGRSAAGEADEKPDAISSGKALMSVRRYQEASKVLAAYKGAYPDLAAYLEAFAVYKSGDADGALKKLAALEETYPHSNYAGKSRMLRASIYLAQKRYTGAEEIMRQRTGQLLSADRKREIANMYLIIAEGAVAKPKVGDPGAPGPNYDKALRLFNYLAAMDLPEDMREYVLYRRTQVALDGKLYSNVVAYGREYMQGYDPYYRTEILGEPAGTAEKAKSGPNVVWVRLAVFEAALETASAIPSGKQYEQYGSVPEPWVVALIDNFIRHIGDGSIKDLRNGEGLRRAMYFRPYALGLKPSGPRAQGDNDLAIARVRRAVAAAKEFISANPGDVRSLELMRQIPRAYLSAGLTDDAIEAYRVIIAGEGLAMEDKNPDEEGTTPQEKLLACQAEAVYRSGQVFFDMGRFNDAGEVWKRYLTAYPNGAEWVDSQRGIYHAMKAVGAKALAEKRYEECRNEWAKIVAARPVDNETPWLALSIAYTHVTQADGIVEEKKDKKNAEALALYKRALDELLRVSQRYTGTAKSYAHLYRAEIYRYHLGDLEAAVREYEQSGTYQARQAVAELTAVELSALSPKVFRNNEAAVVKISTRNVPKLAVRVYRIDLEDFFKKYHTTMNVRRLDLDLVSPDRTWEVEIPGYAKYADIEHEMPVEVDGPGAYAVTLEGEEYEATTLVVKSDVELIAATSYDEAIVLVKNALTESPVEGAEVTFYAGEKTAHTLALKTGRDGVGKGKFSERPSEQPYIFAAYQGNYAMSGAGLSGAMPAGLHAKGYIYTSRPVYLPGETVPVKGIIREVKDGSYYAPADQKMKVKVLAPDMRLLAEKEVTLGRFGSFSTEFKLPEESPLGRYSVSTGNGGSYTGTFQVQIVQPSKVFVELTPSVPAALAGDTVEIKAKAAYYTGLPLVERAVVISLPDGRTVRLSTDDKGEAVFQLDTTPFFSYNQVTVSATVPGEDAGNSVTMPLLPAALKLVIELAEDEYLVNQRVDVPITLTTPDDKPAADRKVSVEVYQKGEAVVMPLPEEILRPAGMNADVFHGQTRDKRIAKEELTTDKDGRAVYSRVFSEKGGISLVFTAADDKGRSLTSTRSITVQEPETPRLALEVDNATVKVGDSVKVTVANDDLPGLGLLLYTGDAIISYTVYKYEKGKKAVSFVVDNAHFPNFKMTGLATGDHRLNRAEQAFDVQRKLIVTLKMPEGPLTPGDEVEATVEATDHAGRPVEAELSLSMVDKGLLDKYPDPTMNIVKFFEQGLRRTAEYLSFSSILFERRGEKQKIASEVLAELKRVKEMAKRDEVRAQMADREKTELAMPMPAAAPMAPEAGALRARKAMVMADAAVDTGAPYEMEQANGIGGAAPGRSLARRAGGGAGSFGKKAGQLQAGAPEAARKEMPIGAYWIGSVETDRRGRAKIKIQVPERTSTYRVQVRGVTPDTLLAEVEDTAVVKRDLFIDLKMPGYLFENDRMRPIVSVHNTGDFKGLVDVKLEIEADGAKRAFPMKVQVEGKGVSEKVADFYDVPAVGKLLATVTASVDGKILDKIEKPANVRIWGVEERSGAVGTSTDSKTLTLNLPTSVRRDTLSLDITLFPGVEAALVDMALRPADGEAVLGLRDGAARVIALAALAEAYGEGRVPGETVEKLREAAQGGASSLIAAQLRDGSWPWAAVPEQRSNYADYATTAWATIALHTAIEGGVLTDAGARDRGINYLRRHAPSDESQALYAMALTGNADFSVMNRLLRQVSGLPVERKALLGLSFDAMNMQDKAKTVAALVARDIKAVQARGRGTSEEPLYARALALMLLSRAGGFETDAATLADAIKNEISGTGLSGQARWLALAALAEGSGPVNTERPAFDVSVTVNGKQVGTYRGSRDAESGRISVAAADLATLPVKIDLSYRGRGELAYRALLKGFSPVIEDRSVFTWGPSSETFYHSPMLYKGRQLVQSAMDVKQTAYDDHVEDGLSFATDKKGYTPGNYIVITRWMPAGLMLDKTSLPANALFAREGGGKLTMVFRGRPGDFRLRLLPYCPGEYRALPTEMAEADYPGTYERLKDTRRLAVLAPDQKDETPYKWSQDEHIRFGTAHFNDGEYSNALQHLSAVPRKQQQYYEEVVKDLLWIYCSAEHYKPGEVVDLFEILQQRYPRVSVPYDKLLVIGKAYHDNGEDEAACYLWKATLENSFRDDVPVAAELEASGEYLKGVDYLRDLFWLYPDLPIAQQTLYGLSQDVYAHKDRAGDLAKPGAQDKGGMLPEEVIGLALDVLKDFLAMFNDLPYSDEAVFSQLNAYLDLKAYDACEKLAQSAVILYPESKYRDRYRYIDALAAFHLGRYEQATDAARLVSGGKGPDSRYATYILGQMYQAMGKQDDALSTYRMVKNDFPDAALSIEYLERRTLELPEVVSGNVGTPVEAEVSYCNVDSIELMAYRVDLMRLYLKEKNLDRIAGVNLAGITPTFTFKRDLEKVPTGTTGKARIQLPIKETGAYLVLARSNDVFASGLALITPLKMEVQEYHGAVRVTIHEGPKATPAEGVHVKASSGAGFVSAETDLRGTATINHQGYGAVTVVARRGKDEYAFHRSPSTAQPPAKPMGVRWLEQVNYDESINTANRAIQYGNAQQLRYNFRRRSLTEQGVMASDAMKK